MTLLCFDKLVGCCLQYVVVLSLVFVVALMGSVLAIVYSAWVRSPLLVRVNS